MRIVLVDDDRLVSDALAFALRDAGHDVRIAAAPEAALAQVSEHAPDVAIVDIRLGGHDGVALIRALRSASPDVSIVAISGGGDAGPGFDDARKAGASLCLQKPFSGRAMLAALARISHDPNV